MREITTALRFALMAILLAMHGRCAGQSNQRSKFVTLCDAGQLQPDAIFLDEVLKPLQKEETKVALIVYNKSREYAEARSIYDVLPAFNFEVFEPFVMNYNGDGQDLEFTSKSRGNLGHVFNPVQRSRAFLVTKDAYWVDFFTRNQTNLFLERNLDLPVQMAGDDFVTFSISLESSVRKRENAEGFTHESEFWHRVHKLVHEVHAAHSERLERETTRRAEARRTLSTSALTLSVLSSGANWVKSQSQWGASNGEEVYSGWSQEASIIFTLSEFTKASFANINAAGGTIEPQVGLSLLRKSLELRSSWEDMQAVDITAFQDDVIKGAEIRVSSEGIREALSLQECQALSVPIGGLWRRGKQSPFALRASVSPGIFRSQALSRLTSGEFDYFLTSSLAPGESFHSSSVLGLTEDNAASNYDVIEAVLRGTSMSYNLECLFFQGNKIWTLGSYFSTMSWQMPEVEHARPSVTSGSFTSTWAGQNIRAMEWGVRLGLSFSVGMQ